MSLSRLILAIESITESEISAAALVDEYAHKFQGEEQKKFLSLVRSYMKAVDADPAAGPMYPRLQRRYVTGLALNKWLEARGITRGVRIN